MDSLVKLLEKNPIVAAIKDEKDLKEAIKADSEVVFILYGNICNIANIVKTVKQSGKLAIVHIDLISGLSSKDISVDFISSTTDADGIISTRPMNIKRAKQLGLLTVLRFFIYDTISYVNIEKSLKQVTPNMIEILPGIMPKIIEKIKSTVEVPIIAGGLMNEKSDVIDALNAGAFAISTSDIKIWKM